MAKMRFGKRIVVVVLSLFAVGCVKNRIDPDLRGVVVRIQPDSVPLERTPELTRFRVNVTIRNNRPTPLYLANCGGPDAQQEINGRWETVWSPVCISLGTSTIAPGDSVMFPFAAVRVEGQRIDPHLDAKATPGRYRLGLGGIYSRPPDVGVIYQGPAPPPAKLLGTLTSPVFIVYSR